MELDVGVVEELDLEEMEIGGAAIQAADREVLDREHARIGGAFGLVRDAVRSALAGFDDQITGAASRLYLVKDIQAVAARLGEAVDADTLKTLTEIVPLVLPGQTITAEVRIGIRPECEDANQLEQ